MSIAFLLTTLVVVVTPGTGVLYTLSAGLSRGCRASVAAAIGCTLGIIPQMIAAITGLAAILNASAIAFQTVKYVGVAYLLYLAYKTFRDKTPLEVDAAPARRSAPRIVLTGILMLRVLYPRLRLTPSASPHAAQLAS